MDVMEMGVLEVATAGSNVLQMGSREAEKQTHKDLLLLFLSLYVFLVPVTDFFGCRAGTYVKVRDSFEESIISSHRMEPRDQTPPCLAAFIL